MKLQSIDLTHNRFVKFPEVLFNIPTIKKLLLTGNRLAEFGDEWSKFEALNILNLENNKLTEMPQVIFQVAKTLQKLNLTRNEISEIPAAIEELTQLTFFSARHNNLSSIPESFGKLTGLTELRLSNNKISSLPDIFADFSVLSVLDLSFNELEELPVSIGKLACLSVLDVNNNKIKSLQPELFLDENFCVQELILHHNELTELPIEMWEIDTILELNASANQISSLPAEISHLYSLVKLILVDNKITIVPEEIVSLEYLEELNLSFNPIESLPDSIGNLFSLSKFYMAYNKLKSIPELTECTGLTEFFVSGNREVTELPKSLWNTSTVSRIYACDMKLTEIPSLEKVPDLEVLDVGFNQIESIPEDIGDLQLLRRLNVTHNKVSSLPSLHTCYDLQNIDISYNQFESVPEEFEEFLERSVEVLFDGNPASNSLDDKVAEETIHIHPSKRFTVGIGDMIGRRPTMEDAMAICGSLVNEDTDFFGLYDGHAGREAATWCGKKIHKQMLNTIEEDKEAGTLSALAKAYPEVNEQFKEYMNSPDWEGSSKHCGTTAVSVYIEQKEIFVVNVGDSRAVMSRGGKALRLSFDHKPYSDEEQNRIRELGGCVTGDTGRVNGLLAIPRAIGDYYMKPHVTDEPFTKQYTLSEEDKFLILGCDGVWDEVEDQKAVDIVASEPNPFKACCMLRDYAYMLGSDDNISVIVAQVNQ